MMSPRVARPVHRTLGAAQQCARTRQQHHRVDGLGHVVVGSGPEPDDLVNVGVSRRENQDRTVKKFAQFAANRQAVSTGQHQVE